MPEIWGWFNSQGGLAVALLCITDMNTVLWQQKTGACVAVCTHTRGVLECECVLVCMHMSTGV